MNRLITVPALALTFLFLWFSPLHAQQSGVWERISLSIPSDNTVTAFAAASPTSIVAIDTVRLPNFTVANVTLRSSDSGLTWKSLLSRPMGYGAHIEYFRSVLNPTPNEIVVLAEDHVANTTIPVMLWSSDTGKTWSEKSLDSGSRVGCAIMRSGLAGALVQTQADSMYDNLLLTRDGWNSYAVVPLPSSIRNVSKIFAVGENAYCLYADDPSSQRMQGWLTINDGKTWTSIGLTPESTKDIAYLTASRAIAVGGTADTTRIYLSNDGGQSWSPVLDTVYYAFNGLNKVSFSDALHGVGLGNVLLSTSDGGSHWQREFVNHERSPGDAYSPYQAVLKPQHCLQVAPNFAIVGFPALQYRGKQTLPPPRPYPHQPGGADTLGFTTATWQPIAGATAYRLQVDARSRHNGDLLLAIVDSVVHDTTAEFNVTRANFYYYYRIAAVNDSEQSMWSSDVTFYTATSGVVADASSLNYLFPNPTANELHLPSDCTGAWLIDQLGTQFTPAARVIGDHLVVDLRSLPNGAYAVVDGKGARIGRVIVAH